MREETEERYAVKQRHQFELTLSKRDGSHLLNDTGLPFDPIPVQADFGPAREWASFHALCRCADPADMDIGEPEPVWDEALGSPYMRAFSISVGANGNREAVQFPTTYFSDVARGLSSSFVQGGQLQAGELFNYLVTARPLAPATALPANGERKLTVRRKTPTLDMREDMTLEQVLATAEPQQKPEDGDLPVFIGQAVMDKIEAQTIAAGSHETGSFLVGHLHRCPETQKVFLRITDQIPAEHTTQALTSLSFSAESFDAVRRTVRERGNEEIICGWAHSHAWFHESCKDCTKGAENGCGVKADFFSEDDIEVQKRAFARAFSVGLVISSSPCSGTAWAMYGWRCAMVQRRGFHVICEKRNREEEQS